ncbi:unnamed protein product [Ceutorhynchus assimilis]|uniref:JmjC domain-containing protein n=1 Tax=Ceutorhynchus assimilis TaxID=467358 RepID=A0A9N9MSM8_9CUCU|nr:unnamed protein product [Ceutorhynchus assimilis]
MDIRNLDGSRVKLALETLHAESQDFLYSITKVPELPCSKIYHDSWPFDFLRDYVSKNFPVLIKGGCNDWAAVKKWNSEYFKEHFSEKDVVVTLTPNGYADGVANYEGQDYFFLPEEKTMKFGNFLKTLQEKKESYVTYIQQQNSNLTQHFSEFMGDVQEEFHWASKAFNKKPDAVNFWMGDERAVTSMHKDPYENIYCVIDGHKDFLLIPPVDLPYVPYKNYPVKKYENVQPGGSFDLESNPQENNIFWIAADPLNGNLLEIYPDFFVTARQFHVRVEKGDVLYLPSFWFHHVRQSHKCIAVNYWYDIDYNDPKYCYYRMLASLCDKDKFI